MSKVDCNSKVCSLSAPGSKPSALHAVSNRTTKRCSGPAGQGPTKAHRLHLKHIQKQFRAWEKRLAALLAKHVSPFLEMLTEVRNAMGITAGLLPCFSLLLETADGRPFAAAHIGEVRPCVIIHFFPRSMPPAIMTSRCMAYSPAVTRFKRVTR
jgi:hypothetical protein